MKKAEYIEFLEAHNEALSSLLKASICVRRGIANHFKHPCADTKAALGGCVMAYDDELKRYKETFIGSEGA